MAWVRSTWACLLLLADGIQRRMCQHIASPASIAASACFRHVQHVLRQDRTHRREQTAVGVAHSFFSYYIIITFEQEMLPSISCSPIKCVTHEKAAEVRREGNGRLQLRYFVVVIGVEPLGHVQGGGSVNPAGHGEHASVAGREVRMAFGHCTEELSPGFSRTDEETVAGRISRNMDIGSKVESGHKTKVE